MKFQEICAPPLNTSIENTSEKSIEINPTKHALENEDIPDSHTIQVTKQTAHSNSNCLDDEPINAYKKTLDPQALADKRLAIMHRLAKAKKKQRIALEACRK